MPRQQNCACQSKVRHRENEKPAPAPPSYQWLARKFTIQGTMRKAEKNYKDKIDISGNLTA